MAINERLIHTAADAAAGNAGEEGLILHLDANDVDSYDGDGDVWYDITNHEYTPTTDVSEHFNTVIWNGDGSADISITGVGFQPDLIWAKSRAAQNHTLIDSVRGVGKILSSDTNSSNYTATTYGQVTSFDSDGFTASKGTDPTYSYFNSSNSYYSSGYVAWCFKAGGAPSGSDKVSIDGTSYATMTAAGLTDGNRAIDKLSVNTKLGFSIVKIENKILNSGSNIAHGLGVPPELIIAKQKNTTSDWIVFSKTEGAERYLVLNSNAASADDTYWGDINPTSTLINFAWSSSASDYIFYCFASKRGVSKVGSYAGTGSSGNKIYTGFEPAFIIGKCTSNSPTNWWIFDNKRGDEVLYPNLNNDEDLLTNYVSFNRDGFTLSNAAFVNQSGRTYIYYAVAKSTKVADLTPSTDGEEIEVDLAIDPSKVHYSDSNYAIEQDGTVWRGNADNSSGNHEGEAYINNYFESGGTGKYYFEVESLGHTHGMVGFTDPTKYTAGDGVNGSNNSKTSFRNNYFYGVSNANLLTYNNNTTYSSLSTGINTAGTVLAVAIDVATRKMWMGTVSSGTITWFSSGNPSTGANPLATLPSSWNFYQPLVADGSWSSGSARTGWHKLLREESASSLPTGFTYMKGAIKNADLELHLDAASFPQKGESGYSNTPSTWTDSSGNGNNGTITSCEFDSELGNFLNFNSGTSEVTYPNNLVGLDGIATAEIWARGTSFTNPVNTDILIQNCGTSNFYFVIFTTQSSLTARVNNSSNTIQTNVSYSLSNFNANDWYHIAATFSGASNPVKLYVNGELVSQGNAQSTFRVVNVQSTIGAEINSDVLTWDGQIGQVRLYSSTLTQAQIRQNFNFTKNDYPNGFNATMNNITSSDWSSSGHFSFSGTDYFRLPSGAPFNDTNTIKAVSGWYKLASTSDRAYIFSISSTSNTNDFTYFSVLGDVNRLQFETRDGSSSNRSYSIVNSTADTDWHHIVFQITATEREIYLDGVKQTATVTNNGTGSNTSWISYPSYASSVVGEIGRLRAASPSSSDYSDADISEVKLYDKELTQSEITAEYNKGQYGAN